MKKVAIFLIVVAALFLLYKKGIIGGKDNPEVLDSKAVLVSENDSLVGLWTMANYKSSPSDGAVVEAATLEVINNGDCALALSYRIDSRKLEGKYEGKCYVDESKTHFKLVDNQGNEKIKWTKYTISDNALYYDAYTFRKVR